MSWLKLAVLVAGYITVSLGIQGVPWDARGSSAVDDRGTVATTVEPALDALALSALGSGEMDAIALAQLAEYANAAEPVSEGEDGGVPPLDPIALEIAAGLSAQGAGILRVLDNGEIVIALAFDRPVEHAGGLVVGKFFRFVAALPEKSLLLPSPYWGEFEVTYDAFTRTVRVDVDQGDPLFRLTVDEFVQGEGVLASEDGVPLIAGAQIAGCAVTDRHLSEALGEEVAGALGVAAWPEWLELLVEDYEGSRQGLDSPGDTCTGCSAGGPGSSSCSVSGCSGEPSGCVVVCKTGKYACCKCYGITDYASCVCCTESE